MAKLETFIQWHVPERAREFKQTTSISSTVLSLYADIVAKQKRDTAQSRKQNKLFPVNSGKYEGKTTLFTQTQKILARFLFQVCMLYLSAKYEVIKLQFTGCD